MPVINPVQVTFRPSAHHDVVQDGVPVVTRYLLRVTQPVPPPFADHPPSVLSMSDLGIPTPDVTSGLITAVPHDLTDVSPGAYSVVISVEGPGGSASAPPVPFYVQTYTAPAPPTDVRLE